MNNSKTIARIFLWIQGIAALLVGGYGGLISIMGTLFFDDPNASYIVFLWRYPIPTALVVASFFYNATLYKKGLFRKTILVSIPSCILAVLFFLGNIEYDKWEAARLNELSSQYDAFRVPTLTHFTGCTGGFPRAIEVNDTHVSVVYWSGGKKESQSLGTVTKDLVFVADGGKIPTAYLEDFKVCKNSENKTFADMYDTSRFRSQ